MNQTVKLLAVSAGTFGIIVLGNLAARAIYTNSKMGVDKRMLMITAAGGIAASFVLMKYYKN